MQDYLGLTEDQVTEAALQEHTFEVLVKDWYLDAPGRLATQVVIVKKQNNVLVLTVDEVKKIISLFSA
jgi:hypothetical protein